MGYLTASGIYVPETNNVKKEINQKTKKANDLFKNINDYLKSMDLTYENVPVGEEKDLYEGTKDFFTGKIVFPEVRILEKDARDFKRHLDILYFEEALDKYIASQTKVGSVYDIPLDYTNDSENLGTIQGISPHSQMYSILYYYIGIKSPSYLMASCTYAHELGHIITGLPHALEVPDDDEVISIFLEKIKALSISSEFFQIVEKNRLKNLQQNISWLLKGGNTSLTYIISNLRAEALFDLYYHSSEADKDRILKCISRITTIAFTVEDVLDYTDIPDIDELDLMPIKRNLQIK